MRTALASRGPPERDPLQPLLVKYLHPLGLGSDDTLGTERTEFATGNLARSAGREHFLPDGTPTVLDVLDQSSMRLALYGATGL